MEDIMNLRAAVQRGVVLAVNDGDQVQTATVQLGDGNTRQCEVWQIDGFGGVPAGDGAIALVFMSGNDPAQPVALLANPSTRLGGHAAGEKSITAPDGTRVALRQGGAVEIWGATSVTINSGSVVMQGLNGADAQVKIVGTLTVTRDIYDQNAAHGSLNTLRSDYNGHSHTDSHGDTTGAPTPQTP